MDRIEEAATASTYSAQAAELRARAADFKNETNRQMLLKAAEGYERMAQWARKLSRGNN